MKVFNKSVLFVAGISAALTLAGCRFFGGNKEKVDPNKITLKIGFWPEQTELRDVNMYNLWKKNFERDNPQYQVIGDPYKYDKETVMAKYATHTLPMVYQTWFTEPETLKNSGYIRDITDILNEFGWTDKIDDEMRETLTFDNKIYGVPRDGYGLGLLINKRILGDCGLLPEDDQGNYSIYNKDGSPAYPTTFAKVKEFSEIVVDSTANTKGFMMCSANKNGGWQFSNIAWNFGAELQVKDSNGKWKANLSSPESISAMQWIADMKADDLLLKGTSIVYDDWASSIGDKVAMAIVGSDVLHLAKTTGDVEMSDLAFVPMPSLDSTHKSYSLYGGTPYVFDSGTTDEQVRGILKFFEYIGRSPSTSEINFDAIEEGYKVAQNKNQPIVPKIMPWKNTDFLSRAKQMENQYVSINMNDYPFFSYIADAKHPEEPNSAQKMYEYLDDVLQNVLSKRGEINVENALITCNAKLQQLFDETINK